MNNDLCNFGRPVVFPGQLDVTEIRFSAVRHLNFESAVTDKMTNARQF